MSPRGERGQGGIEVVPFGLLVFVAGTLLLANVWGVVDAKTTVAAAAREATRSYVEAPTAGSAELAATDAARETTQAAGRELGRLLVRRVDSEAFARCARVTFEARYRVPALRVPWLGAFGEAFTVASRHSELVDPLRSGLPGKATCGRS